MLLNGSKLYCPHTPQHKIWPYARGHVRLCKIPLPHLINIQHIMANANVPTIHDRLLWWQFVDSQAIRLQVNQALRDRGFTVDNENNIYPPQHTTSRTGRVSL